MNASSGAGLFYGAVTLWQLVPTGANAGEIAAQSITDGPRYPWRGLMLDSSRHFQSPAFVRSMIDWMGWHKLNVLHWHLTDDQGWRLQIRKYPKLTSVGAWRIPASVRDGPPPPRWNSNATRSAISCRPSLVIHHREPLIEREKVLRCNKRQISLPGYP